MRARCLFHKRLQLAVAALSALVFSCTTKPPSGVPNGNLDDAARADGDAAIEEEPVVLPGGFENLPVSTFRESWAYLETGSEADLKTGYPITDIGYFAASVSSYGKLIEIPKRQGLSKFKGRVHLVAVCWGGALTHFALEPGSATRRQLIADLLRASADFDGLQIDYENVLPGDSDAFLSFLKELRAGLGNKVFSVALQARVKTLQNDPEDYARIAPLVDRIIVMAYDEHWSSGEPGPVASMNWCRSVARYSLQTVGADKIVMGVPFYGRTWGNVRTNRAFFQEGIDRIKREQGITEVRRANGVPYFTYTLPVTVTAYYDDEYSIATRLDMYASLGVKSVGFWKLGQEKPVMWKLLRLSR